MATHDENPVTQEVLISRENTAASESPFLGNPRNLDPDVEMKDGSNVNIEDMKKPQTYKTKVLLTLWIFCSFVSLVRIQYVIFC